MWKLFHKKKEETKQEHTDFSKYKIKVNAKVMCAYEAMTGKPFLKVGTEDEIKHLFYCSLVVNNDDFSTMDYETFEFLVLDNEVAMWLSNEYIKIGKFISQFKTDIGDEEETAGDGEGNDKIFYMLDVIPGLIVRMGLDPNYVMYRMEEWEISYYYRIMQDMDRNRLAEERLWTYLQVLPHVGKKLAGPEKMLPFPWENSKKKVEKELEKNTAAAMAFLGGNKNGKEPDDRTEQE